VELRGTVAIVTGGGTGIGHSVCLALARAGSRAVVVNYPEADAQAAHQTAAEVSGYGVEGWAYLCDVTCDAVCRRMAADAVERFGRVDVLVNNAGITRHIPQADLEAVDEEAWDEILDVNLRGAFRCSRATASALREARGSIVNIGSIGGLRSGGSSLPYGVSKAALLQLTRSLAVALAPEVRVNSVSPGLVATRWYRRVDEAAAEAQERAFAAHAPLSAVAGPEHVAQAVLGLLAMDLVTGENLIVDGGMHLLYGPPRP